MEKTSTIKIMLALALVALAAAVAWVWETHHSIVMVGILAAVGIGVVALYKRSQHDQGNSIDQVEHA